MPAQQQKPSTQSKYYPFNGGLDVVTPALSVDPGFALAMINYEPWYNGGYRRIDGYERFDGRAKPSLGTAFGATISSLSGITINNSTGTFTGAQCKGSVSNATGQLVFVSTIGGTPWVAITNVSGTFTSGDKLLYGTSTGTATSTGTLTVNPSANYGPAGTGTDGYLYTAEFLAAAQNYYRQQIQVVPGTGNVLGVWQNGTNIYAVRGTGTSGQQKLWLSSGTGWTQSGITMATTVYYSGLAQQNATFTGNLDPTGLLFVTAVATGTLFAGQTISDTTGLVPIAAVITTQIGGAAGGTGTYQLSVMPALPVASETMYASNDTAKLPTAGQLVVGLSSLTTATCQYAISHDTQTGYLVFNHIQSGTGYVNGETLQYVSGGTGTTFAVASGTSSVFALPTTAGRYRFKNANFYASANTYNTYGCNGQGPAFQIDQNNLVTPILLPKTTLTGQPPANTPFLLEAHANFLFLAFPNGVYQQSVAGSPLQFNGFLGAAEFGVGAEITGLFSMVGPNLIVPTQHSSFALAGNSDANFVQSLVGEKVGMQLYSGQLLDTIYALNNLGITSLSRTQSYGNFVGSTVSQLIQPIVSALRSHFTDSTIVRASNQARFYFDDGSCLIMFVPGLGQQNKAWSAIESGVTAQFGYASYPTAIYAAWNSEDASNNEVNYFALNNGDGYVYQDRSGTSFDGAAVTSYVRLVFNNIGSPAIRKYFRRADLELNAQAQVFLKFAADLSYSSDASSSGISALTANNIPDITVFGGGGYWDSIYWNQFYWDGQSISTARATLNGTGQNVSFLIFHQAITDAPFVLQGLTIYFDPRRLQR